MSKLVKKFDYNLNKNFYDAPFKAELSTNKYNASKDLLYWLRFANGSRPQELSLSQNSLSATYTTSNVINSESFIGNRSYPSFDFDAKFSKHATFLDKRINFQDFDTVEEFTTSIWILPKNIIPSIFSNTILNFLYEYQTTKFKTRIKLNLAPSGRISLIIVKNITDLSSSPLSFPNNIGLDLNLNEWNHVVFVYKKTANPNERTVEFIVNGIFSSSTKVLDLDVGIGYGPLRIAQTNLSNFYEVAELATWNRALTTDEVQAIYNATRGNSWVQASGFVSDSPRLALRDRDHATGSYPARSAHGMPDFNGRYGVQYFDNDAVDFTSNYVEGSFRFGSLPRLNTSLHLTGTQNANGFRKRFQFTAVDSVPWKDLGAYYAVPLRLNSEVSASLGSFTKRLKDAINDSSIGLEATLASTNSIDLRHHVPFVAINNSIRFTNLAIRSTLLDITTSQFRVEDFESKVYPTMLPASSRWSDSGTIFPHEPSDIEAAGRSAKGIADAHVTFTPGQDLLPFVDSRLDIDESKTFYSEGTPDNELPGFSARLSSKDSFVIDINPTTEHEVYFSTGTYHPNNNLDGIRAHGGISYFNFHGPTKGWQKTNESEIQLIEDNAPNLTYLAVDYINSSFSIASSSLLSVIPSTSWGFSFFGLPSYSNLDTINNVGNIGRPCSFSGFPLASKFDPTEEQKIRMSDYINGPFLLEKVVVEVSGVLSSYPPFSSSVGVSGGAFYQNGYGNQVMIINTYDVELSSRFEGTIDYLTGTLKEGASSNPVERKNLSSTFDCKKLKDIVWYGRVGSYANDSEIPDEEFKAERIYQNDDDFKQSPFGVMYDSVYPVKTNLIGGIFEAAPHTFIEPYNFHTGTIRVEAPLRTSGISSNTSLARLLRTSTEPDGEPVSQERTFLFGESKGGRKLLEVSSDRSYIKGVGGARRLADADYSYRLTNKGTVSLERYSSEESLASPYVLMPTDELTIAWVNQPYPLPDAVHDDYPEGEHNVATVFRTKLSPGIGKVTFYGSYLRDGQPLSPEVSQPLTSDAIHEDVRDDASPYGEARCMDQFLVEPTLSYSGSYLDTKRLINYIDGTSIVFSKIVAGWDHTLGLSADGDVYTWGDNGKGQLGQGNISSLQFPTIVDFGVPGLKFTDIAAGNEMSCALDSNGRVWMWGNNKLNNITHGLLGTNNPSDDYITSPARIEKMVRPFASLEQGIIDQSDETIVPKVTKVFSHASSQHFVGLIGSNEVPPDVNNVNSIYKFTNVLMWGCNVGALNLFAPVNPAIISPPSPLRELFKNPVLVPYHQKPFPLSVEYYWFHRKVALADTVGDNVLDESLLFVPNRKIFNSAAVGKTHAMLLTSKGSATNNRLYSYGFDFAFNNNNALLGQDNFSDPSKFNNKIMHVRIPSEADDDDTLRILQIAAGFRTSYAILGEKKIITTPPPLSLILREYYLEKFVYSWGEGASGKLGHGNNNNVSNPQTLINYFLDQPIPNSIAAGPDHAVAIYNYKNQFNETAVGPDFTGLPPEDDIIWAWGSGNAYRLGNNLISNKNTPQEIKIFDNWQPASINNPLAASASGSLLVRDGGYWAWGTGKLGVGNANELSGTEGIEVPKEYTEFIKFSTEEYIGSSITDQYQKSSLQRFFKLDSSSETFYDSHVPFIKDIVQKANIKVLSPTLALVAQDEGKIQTAYLHLPGTLPENHTEIDNWILSFPFAPLFDGIERSDSSENANGNDNIDKTAIDTFFITGSNGVLNKNIVILDTLRSPGPFAQFPLIDTFVRVSNSRTFLNFFYGFGDFAGRLPIDSSKLKQGSLNAYKLSAGSFYYLNENKDPELLIVPRGWKYGLINANPLPKSAFFRCDSYGQFRDMLEQGLDSAFFEKEKTKIQWLVDETNLVSSIASGINKLFESPVSLRFISREDGSVLNPEETNSQNLSCFATSSLPYFDGEGRDRGSPQPDEIQPD